ncbi:MAG: hypothetical protein SOZ45_04740 [Ruminococcus sp.]|nr:hypothetical protein [Ruminococcus sp.]
MKRLISLICAVFLFSALFMCSCKKTDACQTVTDFSAQLSVSSNDISVKADFSSARQGVMNITVTEPDTLCGSSYSYKDGELTYSLGGLSRTGSVDALPDSAFFSRLYRCFSLINAGEITLCESTDNQSVFTAEEENCQYKIFVNRPSGFIDKIQTDDFTFEFTNVSPYA